MQHWLLHFLSCMINTKLNRHYTILHQCMQVEFADAWESVQRCRWLVLLSFPFSFPFLLHLQITVNANVSWSTAADGLISLSVPFCFDMHRIDENVQVLSDTHISLPIWESWRFNFRRRRKCVADTEAPSVSAPLIQFSACVWAC